MTLGRWAYRGTGLAAVLAVGVLSVPGPVGAQPVTTTTSPITTTTAPTTTAVPPTTTTTVAPTTTTTTHSTTTRPTTTTSTTAPTTTTTVAGSHTSSSIPAGAWVGIAAAIVLAIVLVALLLARRRRAERAIRWRKQAGSTVDQLDSLAVHLGSAEPSTLPNLSARDGPRLASLTAALEQLRADPPQGTRVEDLGRLSAAAGALQTHLAATQFPDRGQAPVGELQRAAAEVSSAAATARAGLAAGAAKT